MSILDQSANPMPMPIFNQCHQSVEPISLTNPYGQVCQSINHLSMQHQSSPIDCHSVRTNRKEMMELVLYGSCWSQQGTIIQPPGVIVCTNQLQLERQSNFSKAIPMSIKCQSSPNPCRANLCCYSTKPRPIFQYNMPILIYVCHPQ